MSEGLRKKKILVVDDSEMNRSILADMLGDDYEILEATNGVEAIAAIKERESEITLMLLDIVMPRMDGFEVLSIMNKGGWIGNIPVIMISAETSSNLVNQAYDMGVTDYISRPFDGKIVRRRVNNTIMLYTKQKMLQGMIAEQILEKEKSSSLMVDILSNIVEFRNGESGLHVLHVRTITETLLKHLAEKTDQYDLNHTKIAMISLASALHDIGKISIDEKILNKPGRLTDEEFVIMKTHSAIGGDMLMNVAHRRDEELVKVAYEICRWHHERYNGRGYPDGLKGEEIPISAQVVAMADVYDALTSKRVYKPAFSHEKAVEMIMNGECGVFNPLLLECLQDVKEYLKEELENKTLKSVAEDEVQSMTEELIAKGDTIASDRTLRLLEQERIKYQFFASMSKEIQFEYNVDTDMVTLSEWGAKYLGVDELVMHPFEDEKMAEILNVEKMHEIRRKVRATNYTNPVVGGVYRLHVNGEDRWHRMTVRAMWEGTEEKMHYTGAIGKFANVDEDYKRMDSLEKEASHDTLTGLFNHMNARKLIEAVLAERRDHTYSLILFDLDHFKDANDQYGHLFGDNVLKHVAQKLTDNLRREDIVARVGGDEFMIFLEHGGNFEAQVKRIFQVVDGEYENFQISVSMGVSLAPKDGEDYETLFHAADQALYVSKRGGRNQYRFYDNSMKGTLSVLSPMDGEE